MTTKRTSTLIRGSLALIALATCCFQSPSISNGQDVAVAIESAVIIEGRVSNVYQSGNDSLVQILVQKSEVPRLDQAGSTNYPSPGEFVYVHVGSSQGSSRFGSRAATPPLPKPQSMIQAYLTLDNAGQWTPDGQDWFGAANSRANSTARGGANRAGAGELGVTTRPIAVGRQTGLAVVTVEPNSPAAGAGIETGDVLLQANRRNLESEAQLLDAYRRSSGTFSLKVRNVRSGQDVTVDVDAAGASPTVARNTRMKPLGAKTTLAFYSGEPALKVTSVDSGSPAERAGISEGLLILQANGRAVSKPEEFEKLVLASRGRLELTIVDPKDKRERTVRVDL